MSGVKERPIPFSGPMVRAILDGRKTQTRRVIKPQPTEGQAEPLEYRIARIALMPPRSTGEAHEAWWASGDDLIGPIPRCPYGVPGDRLWVRETWALVPRTAYRSSTGVEQTLNPANDHDAAVYREGWVRVAPSWRSPIFMPRWASRLTLEVTEVRVQRLQEISAEDVAAEGIDHDIGSPLAAFAAAWDSIYEKRAPWDTDPWVWALTFKVAEPPAEQ